MHNEENTFGLITVDIMAETKKTGHQKMYTFLHLTFQEYLGACFISSLGEEDQLAVIAEHGKKEHKQLWKFFCGLATFEDSKKFEDLINSVDRDDKTIEDLSNSVDRDDKKDLLTMTIKKLKT